MYPYFADQTSVSPPWNKGTGALYHERTETAISRCSVNDKDRLPYVIPVITQKPHFLSCTFVPRRVRIFSSICSTRLMDNSQTAEPVHAQL
ncbi:unnamed protein product, partial [Nesidiocoris tenuis]